MSSSTRREHLMASLASRPTLATTSSDFALNLTSSNGGTSAEATSPFLRLRKNTLLSSKSGYMTEPRIQSPLATSFNPPSRESSLRSDYESDRDAAMCTDSPSGSSSENLTPSLGPPIDVDTPTDGPSRSKSKRTRSPSTPPRGSAGESSSRHHLRRLSHPVSILFLIARIEPDVTWRRS
jgi:hypothetical protein